MSGGDDLNQLKIESPGTRSPFAYADSMRKQRRLANDSIKKENK